MMGFLLARGADVQTTDDEEQTMLHQAVRNGARISLMELLIENGIKVNAKDEKGETALHLAVCKRQTSKVKLFLERGADANAKPKSGDTALHITATKGLENIFLLLLQHDADITAQNTRGATALHNAVEQGRLEMTRILLERGADPKLRLDTGAPTLHLAASYVGLIDLLLKYGAELEATDPKGWTVLFQAANSENWKTTVPHLNKLGSDIHRKDNSGNTLLHLVAINYEFWLVDGLGEGGILVDGKNAKGNTLLHIAAEGYNLVIKILLKLGADPNRRDSIGRTALYRE